jgi:hypothetical protein
MEVEDQRCGPGASDRAPSSARRAANCRIVIVRSARERPMKLIAQ